MNTLSDPLFAAFGAKRVALLGKIVLCIGFLVLLTRLAELQVIKGQYFRTLSEDNRVREVTITAPRGKILARGGEVLAENKEVAKIVQFDPISGYAKELAPEGSNNEDVLIEWNRMYPQAGSTAHIVGYLGDVGAEEVGKPDPHCTARGIRQSNTQVGRTGLEAEYDCLLRGRDGKELVEVDIQGKKVRTIGRVLPEPGNNLQTTIDFGLQKKLSESFHELKGAVVATDGHGQILGLYSNPSFDPALFSASADPNIRAKLFADKKLPLFNRAISGGYHPGSIFKIIVGSAALDDRRITSDYTYTDTGSIHVNGFDYTTWFFNKYGKTEGEITFARALARSTDTFFYQVGELVGIDRLDYWADQFGVGRKTGVDLPGEVSGLLPTPEWKQAVLGERWYLGNTFHFSIGQGDLLVTPLQANVLTSVIANGGQYCPPYLTFEKQKSVSCRKVAMSQDTINNVLIGMKMACEPGGTGAPFFDFETTIDGGESARVACKTGTAETGEKSEPHAWFTVFAPAVNPEIILSVLVENGGEGSAVAAPIAKEVFEYWFHGREKTDL